MSDKTADSQRFCRTPPADHLIADLLAAQEGVISIAQLREAGLGIGAIRHRIRQRRFDLVYRGVCAPAGVRVSPHGRTWAAFLASLPGAVVSHRSAAAMWGIRHWPSRPEVSVPPGRRGVKGLVTHEMRDLSDAVELDGLMVTTVARTLLDLCDVLTPYRVELAYRRAKQQRLLDFRALETVMTNGRKGIPVLTSLMRRDPQGVPDSPLSERILKIIVDAQLPDPITNEDLILDGKHYRPDFYWPSHHLVVEADGRDPHEDRFDEDRTRDIELQLHGIRTVRYTNAHRAGFVRTSLLALLA